MRKENAKWFGLGILLMMFLSFVALAFEEGDIISRATFSNQDFTSQNLDCVHHSTELDLDNKMVVVTVSCLSAEINSDENILVIRQPLIYRIALFGTAAEGEMKTVKQCVLEGNTPKQCWNNEFKPKIIQEVRKERGIIRLNLDELKDIDLPANINLNDFALTSQELNN